ncbi:MAG TPA: exonuclease subunit SbcD [Dehalococcoidia bacterium]|nr:exonuclease subunit SbcD [Dehalococcoidia bacterium]
MKLLFSADWHLGYTLAGANPAPRIDDQVRQIERIAAYCQEHAVDVLAIAGDVFEAQERGAARSAVQRMTAALREPLARGMRIVAVAGNHDRDYFMETANVWLAAESSPGDERIIFRTRPDLVTIAANGERVNFALLPFPTPSRYDLRQDDAGGVAHRNEQLARLFIEKMEELRKETAAQKLPTVLLTHVTVEGSTVKAHRISQRDDVVVPRGAFPDYELTVIGHIHKAERIGAAHFYYVGALDRMDVGEKAYEPRVLLADIGPAGLRDITSLPLDPTPFEAVLARDEDELIAARERLQRPDDTLVKLTLAVPYGTYTAALLETARRLFPRLYGNVEHDWQDAPEPAAIEGLNKADVEETVRRYLEEQAMPDDERAALMQIVAELRAASRAEVDA